MKLVVVGGVAAGASIAARARRLDEFAEIVVFERGHHVSFANCGLPYHIGGVITDRSRLLVQTPESLREALDLDVRIGHGGRRDRPGGQDRHGAPRRRRHRVHRVVRRARAHAWAPRRIRPPMPGIDLPGVHVLRRIGDMDQIKTQLDALLAAGGTGGRGAVRAVVVGAGYIGLEMAENLAPPRRRGRRGRAGRPDPPSARSRDRRCPSSTHLHGPRRRPAPVDRRPRRLASQTPTAALASS